MLNEEHFMLALRRDRTLLFSKMYSFSGESEQSRRETLTDLSFFIAHSLDARHPDGTYSAAEIVGRAAVPGPQREDGGEMGGGGDKGRSHRRSDSQATVGGGKGKGNWVLKLLSFLREGCVGGT